MEQATNLTETKKLPSLDFSKPGYSAKFLDFLNQSPDIRAADIKALIPKILHRPDAIARVLENSRDFSEKDVTSVESKGIQAVFVPELWEAELSQLKGFVDDPSVAKSTPFDFLENERSSRITSNPISKSLLVERKIQIMEHEEASKWEKKYEALIQSGRKQDSKVRAYMRLHQLLDKRVQESNGPDTYASLSEHMKGVLDQARQIVWTLFRTAYVKAKEKYPQDINPEEFKAKTEAAVASARNLTFALASSHPALAQSVIGYINADLIAKSKGGFHFGNARGYESDCFVLVENSGKDYLELNPAIFFDLFEIVSNPKNPDSFKTVKTKCPAILVTDDSNRNVVSAYFEQNKDLFTKHCL